MLLKVRGPHHALLALTLTLTLALAAAKKTPKDGLKVELRILRP
jgi:hypothetical protein